MTERLTELNCYDDYQILEEDLRKAIDKLGKLEDIMEKYHCNDIEELDKKLTDADTWKRACELACDVLRDINYKIYNEDRIDFENTFYQQAKTEGENNDTNN